MQKDECRLFIKKINSAHNLEEEKNLSLQIEKKLFALPEFLESQIVLSFASNIHEVFTDEINKKILLSEKKLALPKTIFHTSKMDFYFLNKTLPYHEQLEFGNFKIREPKSNLLKFNFADFNFENENTNADFSKKKIFVIVPGVAFDKKNNRLGHGKAFYDIYLSSLIEKKINAYFCGICFNWQILKEIPSNQNDIKMNSLIFA